MVGEGTRLDRVSPYQIRSWRRLLRLSRETLSSFPAFLIRSLPHRLGRVRLRTCARLPLSASSRNGDHTLNRNEPSLRLRRGESHRETRGRSGGPAKD